MPLNFSVICYDDISLFVYSSSEDRQNLFGPNNFGTLFYELISYFFMLWKFYLDVLVRIVLNQCNKFILLVLLSGLDTDESRNSSVCNSKNCFGMISYLSYDKLFNDIAKIVWTYLSRR